MSIFDDIVEVVKRASPLPSPGPSPIPVPIPIPIPIPQPIPTSPGGVVDVIGALKSLQDTVVQKTASGLLGPEAARLIADIQRVATPVDENTGAAIYHGVERFIATGDINALEPATLLMAAEITRCHNLLWNLASDIPSDVVGALPTEAQKKAAGVRVLTSADVPGSLNAPSIAIDHLHKANAMTIVDIIVFDVIPGHSAVNDLFLWAHELHHVAQYRSKGIAGFCSDYMSEEMGFHAAGRSLNALEAEADDSACRLYPGGNPHYLASCPVPE